MNFVKFKLYDILEIISTTHNWNNWKNNKIKLNKIIYRYAHIYENNWKNNKSMVRQGYDVIKL